jgi:SAM-dependent methyltransferase
MVDRDLLFSWRNDPFVVERSTSRRNINLQEHNLWFDKILASTEVLAFVILLHDQPIGHLRFEKHGDYSVITIYLVKEKIEKGYGVEAIKKGSELAQMQWPSIPVVAYVREENVIGQRGFSKAGFAHEKIACPAGHVAMVFRQSESVYSTVNQYRQLFAKHGQSYKTLNWGSREGQQLRFKILTEIGRLEGKRILDVGCGLGDFAGWLAENNIQVDYTGLDLTPELVAQAQMNYPNLQFLSGSILDEALFSDQTFDFVFASGIFYTYSDSGDAWLKLAVARMWRLCRNGIAFNSLSAWADEKEAGEYYADPDAVLAYCRELTPWVAMRHDYHLRDFSIFMSREARR